MKALIYEHTPSPEEMRSLNISYVLLESLVGAYMLLSVLVGNPSKNECVADPSKFTASLFYYCFIPFYFLRMFAIVFLKSQRSVVYQLVFIWLGSFIAVCIWDFIAIYRFTELEGCKFNLAYFNLILYFVITIHSPLILIALPFWMCWMCSHVQKHVD